jgi:hypothetical protein
MDIAQFADVAVFGSAVLLGFGMMLRHLLERNKHLSNRLDQLMNNHLAHNTEALTQLKHAVIDLRNTLQQWRNNA